MVGTSIFGSINLTLNDICDAYQVPYNMDALRKMPEQDRRIYYGTGNDYEIIPLSGPISMSIFRGRYSSINLDITRLILNSGGFASVNCRFTDLQFNNGKMTSVRLTAYRGTSDTLSLSTAQFQVGGNITFIGNNPYTILYPENINPEGFDSLNIILRGSLSESPSFIKIIEFTYRTKNNSLILTNTNEYTVEV